MTASLVILMLVVIGLAVALVWTRRRLGTVQTRLAQTDNRLTAVRGDLTAVAEGTSSYEAVLDQAPIAIVIVDAAGAETYSNAVATEHSSAATDETIVGLRLREFMAEAVASTAPIESTVELYSPASRTMRLQAIPLFEDDARVGTATFVEDLTERSRVDSIRSDFIANASHELKTPLGALRLLAEALVATDDEAVRTSLGQRFQGEAERMTRLVDDILDLALIEDDQHIHQPVDLCEVVAEAKEQTRLLSETLGVPTHDSCASVTISGDKRRLVSAVANLIENAITYTAAKGNDDPGAVEIRVFPDADLAVIEVEDNGIGIPERHLERIFERFYRVERGRSRASGGTGLGLAIVSHVVQNHDGDLSVESVPGTGSTFRIELPQQDR